MQRNRTMPDDVLVPVLAYPSVTEAVAWLTRAFGFTLAGRSRSTELSSELARAPRSRSPRAPCPSGSDHVMIRVSDVDAHRARASAAGAAVDEAEDHFYGERQYTATDLAGRNWVFSQSIADIDPAAWVARTT